MTRHLLIFAIFALGCEQPHPAHSTVEAVMTAAQYGDHETIVAQHLDASVDGPYCNEGSQKILNRIKSVKSAESCLRSRARSQDEVNGLVDEERFLEQMLRYVCSVESPTCDGYGREVISRALRADGTLRGVSRYEIKKIVGDTTQAVAYVDIVAEEVLHRTLRFEKKGESWMLVEGLTK